MGGDMKLDNANTIPKDDTPVEVEAAARTFTVEAKGFHDMVDSLSLKSAKRILKALVFFPLQEDNVRILAHKEEFVVFEKAMEIMEAKVKMIDWAEKTKMAAEAAKENENGKIS